MIGDPYKVLGLTPSASADEVKKAYRTLAKKYHPDLNPGDKTAEQKMKEVNEAYDMIVNHKYDPNAQSGQSSYSSGGYGRGYSNPFEGFNFGGFGFNWGENTYNGGKDETADLRAARNYINTGHYAEALNLLNRISVRSAYWYYLAALASSGTGDNINALRYARSAVNMEPYNQSYAELLERLENAGGARDFYGSHFRMPRGNLTRLLYCCIGNALLNLCCGGRFFCC